jgi:hypothetical protein
MREGLREIWIGAKTETDRERVHYIGVVDHLLSTYQVAMIRLVSTLLDSRGSLIATSSPQQAALSEDTLRVAPALRAHTEASCICPSSVSCWVACVMTHECHMGVTPYWPALTPQAKIIKIVL